MWVVNVRRLNRQTDRQTVWEGKERKGEVGGDFRLPITNFSFHHKNWKGSSSVEMSDVESPYKSQIITIST